MRIVGQGSCWRNAIAFHWKCSGKRYHCEVYRTHIFTFTVIFLQEYKECDPRGRDCIEKNYAQTFNCNVTCEGIYADVALLQGKGPKEILKDKNPDGLDNVDLLRLISEYKAFRRTQAQHFKFNSAANSSLFGELDCL